MLKVLLEKSKELERIETSSNEVKVQIIMQ